MLMNMHWSITENTVYELSKKRKVYTEEESRIIIGSNYLVCINNSLVVGELRAIYQYTVVVQVYGYEEYARQAISKANVICSVASEAVDVIVAHYA